MIFKQFRKCVSKMGQTELSVSLSLSWDKFSMPSFQKNFSMKFQNEISRPLVKILVWKFCLEISLGNFHLGSFVWKFVWKFSFGNFVCNFRLEILFGNFVWKFRMEISFGNFVWKTYRRTDRPTERLVEAPSRSLKSI